MAITKHKKNGHGTCILPDGSKYDGHFWDGKFHGQGVLSLSNGANYDGEFKNGLRNGQGTLTWLSGSKYVGKFKDGELDRGIFTWPDGSTYTGHFKDGKFNDGQAVFTWRDGSTYVGHFINGKRDGRGVFTWPDSSTYTGWFKDGKLDRGIFTWPDGSTYTGWFKDGMFHGKGTLADTDGFNYVGEFTAGMRDDRGTLICPNGDKYSGEFKDSICRPRGLFSGPGGVKFTDGLKDLRCNGEGTWSSLNGEKYSGEFKDSEFHGEGTFTWPIGQKYAGAFKNDMFHGRGILTWFTGSGQKYDGAFKADMFHGPGTLTWPDGKKYKGEFKDDVPWPYRVQRPIRFWGRSLSNWKGKGTWVVEKQDPRKISRIGYLSAGFPSSNSVHTEAFRQGLHELGYMEGKHFEIEYRYAEEDRDRLPTLAAELVSLNVDVIVAGDPQVTRAAKAATISIPIVMTLGHDPVEYDFVARLTPPGGNITGLVTLAPELKVGKRLELLKEIIPKVFRVAVIGPSTNADNVQALIEMERAARAFKVKLQHLYISDPKDLETAFRSAIVERWAEAVLILVPCPVADASRTNIAALALKHRIPVLYPDIRFVDAGGLMSYGTKIFDVDRRAATYIDQILKGRKPADLPIEHQPEEFEFIINLNAAKEIKLTIPPKVMARADRMIK